MSTRRTAVSTSKVSTSHERIDIRIPKKSKIYEFLYVDTVSSDTAAWKRLDRLLLVAAQHEDDLIIATWEDFVRRISFFYPEKRTTLEKLRPLILRKVLRGEKLEKDFWEEIKKS